MIGLPKLISICTVRMKNEVSFLVPMQSMGMQSVRRCLIYRLVYSLIRAVLVSRVRLKLQINNMPIINNFIEIQTSQGINIHNITPQIKDLIASTAIKNGQILVFSRHTTTALAINENEERLLEDVVVFLRKLAPESDRYLHNDLHLRDVPPDEPINAHSHLMAMMLSTSEVIPIVEGKLALGTYQSVLFFELDGPRKRTVLCQISGE